MTGHKTSRRPPEIVLELYNILEPLDPATRMKAVRSVLMLLDQPSGDASTEAPSLPVAAQGHAGEGNSLENATKHRRPQSWLSKNGLTQAILDHVFHADGEKQDLIAAPPGKQKREQTINAYLLTGVRQFLATGEPRFTEADAVAICKEHGCYDMANHAETRGKFGNRVTGNKESGYTLTTPGLEAAAALIRQIAES